VGGFLELFTNEVSETNPNLEGLHPYTDCCGTHMSDSPVGLCNPPH
jgi:hypothetical protein